MLTSLFLIVIALSLTLTFFGKGIIGVGVVVTFILSIVALLRPANHNNFIETIRSDFVGCRGFLILCIITVLSLSSYNGLDPARSFQKLFEFGGISLSAYIILQALKGLDINFLSLFKAITLTLTFCGLLMLLAPFLGEYAMVWDNHYGSVIAILFPLSFMLSITEKNKGYIWFICMGIIVASVIASNGRTAWVALSINTILMMVFLLTRNIPSKLKYFFLCLLVIIAGVFAGKYSYEQNFGKDMFDSRSQSMVSSDRPASGRLLIWQGAIDQIEQNPWFGIGIKNSNSLKMHYRQDGLATHAHNIILEITLETGLIGLGLLSLALLLMVWRYIKAYIKSENKYLKLQAMALLAAFMTYGICSMALTSVFHTWWFLYLVVLLVLMKVMEIQLKANKTCKDA